MEIIKERIEYWMEIAEYDLETADAMLKSKRYLYLGFMCHQVIEKSMKAYYWKNNKTEPPYIHHLLILAEKSGLINLLDGEKKDLLNQLIPLNIQARYPEDKELLLKSLTYNKCRTLLRKTKDFNKWIAKLSET